MSYLTIVFVGLLLVFVYTKAIVPHLTVNRFRKQGIYNVPGYIPLLGHLLTLGKLSKEQIRLAAKGINSSFIYKQAINEALPEIKKMTGRAHEPAITLNMGPITNCFI